MMLLILGAGESGIGAALLAEKYRLPFFISDRGMLNDDTRMMMANKKWAFEEGGHNKAMELDCDLIVKSPGIPDDSEVLQSIMSRNKLTVESLISEIEFASRYTDKPIIAITGSNGKTTTTKLIHYLLRQNGMRSSMAGNIGRSFARALVEDGDYPDYFILEVSSFQLDNISSFRPKIAVILNITPDHLDRYHQNMSAYANTKMRLTLNQGAGDTFIYARGDDWIERGIKELNPAVHLMAIEKDSDESGFVVPNGERVNFADISLKGRHNAFNISVACAVLDIIKPGHRSIDYLSQFINAPHRMQFVAEYDGISFINDSKATNVDSVYYALDAIRDNIIWIVGGTDKGNDYTPLNKLINNRVKAIIGLGADNALLQKKLSFYEGPFIDCRSMSDAVEAAMNRAVKGDTVLLSPACASFDLFRNYEDRGEQFIQAVLHLKSELCK